jgi:hypothetical protein
MEEEVESSSAVALLLVLLAPVVVPSMALLVRPHRGGRRFVASHG